MPRSSTAATVDIANMIRSDHSSLRSLFREFYTTRDTLVRKEIAGQAIKELQIHTVLEEEFVYPALVAKREEDVALAREEHHVAKLLLGELEGMDAGERLFDVKFRVLADSAMRHMEEEERDLLNDLAEANLDETTFAALTQRKQDLEDHPDRLADLFRDAVTTL